LLDKAEDLLNEEVSLEFEIIRFANKDKKDLISYQKYAFYLKHF
jgi:hypothetical protein